MEILNQKKEKRYVSSELFFLFLMKIIKSGIGAVYDLTTADVRRNIRLLENNF
jgi:hypothetical protein